MKSYDIVIIGASAAGLTAALTARRHYPGKSILIIREHELVPIPCGIPYSFGLAEKPENNLIPVSKILPKNNIDGLIDTVTNIDRDARTVITETGETISFDRLIIATGSRPIVPPIPGSDKKNVFPVKKNIPFLNSVVKQIDRSDSMVLVGCGFIGVEFAEECRRRKPDMNIYVVEMLRHCLQLVYDEDLCEQAEKTLKDQGVSLLLDEKVQEITGDECVNGVKLASGKIINTDMIILGIGAEPETKLAKRAQLETGPTDAIYVDRYMQTSDRHIFACGDNAEKVSFFDGKPSRYKLASIATMEARVAGANLFGITRVNMGVIGVYSTVLGETAYAAAGLTQSQAEEKGYRVAIGDSEAVNRHPGCLPDTEKLRVKLLFETGSQVIIGGQVSGAKSGGELINAISACIIKKMTADDIATFQTGTHPRLTASPVAYQLVNAAEMAIREMHRN